MWQAGGVYVLGGSGLACMSGPHRLMYTSLMYTQHPILTEKHRIVDIFADLLKKKN